MKKFGAILLACLLFVGLLAGCTSIATPPASDQPASTETKPPATSKPPEAAPTPAPEGTLKGKLTIWSFTDEVKTFATAFKGKYPEIDVEYTMIPMTNGEYQTKVQSSLSSGEVPDVIVLEASFVKAYVESDFLMDLGELLPLTQEMQTYQNTIDVGTYDGVLKALSYQSTPGALFYRRSLAKEYFGTDDPAAIQNTLSDMAKYEEAAKVVKEKSNGNTFMVASLGDFTNLYFANREQPWVVDDKLTIDPMVDELFEVAKSFRANGYEAQATQWQEGWFAGMNDSLKDAAGNPKQIFSYFLPTWGLPYVLIPNSSAKEADGVKSGKDTAGDWACIPGPLPYQWGGTWVGVMKDAANPETAKEFVRFMTLNPDTLKSWALGEYTNEFLRVIDPSVGETLSQGPGDFVSSKKVVDEIMAEFDSAQTSKFLSGQNSYKGFADAAPSVDSKLMQGTDDAIQRALNDVLADYASGNTTKEAAMQTFKDAVKNALPDIIVD